jgi:hypothetical protein
LAEEKVPFVVCAFCSVRSPLTHSVAYETCGRRLKLYVPTLHTRAFPSDIILIYLLFAGTPSPFVPDDTCADDIFEGAMDDQR